MGEIVRRFVRAVLRCKDMGKLLNCCMALACFALAACSANLVLRADQQILNKSLPHIQQVRLADPFRANIELVVEVPGGDGLINAEHSGKDHVGYTLQLPAKDMMMQSFGPARERWVTVAPMLPPVKLIARLQFLRFRESPLENSTRALVMAGIHMQWLNDKGQVLFERLYDPGEQRSASIINAEATPERLLEEYNKATYKSFVLAFDFALREISSHLPVR